MRVFISRVIKFIIVNDITGYHIWSYTYNFYKNLLLALGLTELATILFRLDIKLKTTQNFSSVLLKTFATALCYNSTIFAITFFRLTNIHR